MEREIGVSRGIRRTVEGDKVTFESDVLGLGIATATPVYMNGGPSDGDPTPAHWTMTLLEKVAERGLPGIDVVATVETLDVAMQRARFIDAKLQVTP